jgi:predicted patatin/cPLA2 family phospholipase
MGDAAMLEHNDDDICERVRDACRACGFQPWEISVELVEQEAEDASVDHQGEEEEQTPSGVSVALHSDEDYGDATRVRVYLVSERFKATPLEASHHAVWQALQKCLGPAMLRISLLVIDLPHGVAETTQPADVQCKCPRPLLVIQGGGARGGWQGGVLYELLSSCIRPVAAVGSSAGAINSWLMSAKLAGDEDNPFDQFWLTIPVFAIPLILLAFVGYLVFRGRLFLHRMFCVRAAKREPAAVPFWLFEGILWLLLPKTRAAIHTYIYAANVDEPEPPPVFDPEIPFRFLFKPGAREAEMIDRRDARVPFARVMAASACLPYIAPVRIQGSHYADGGFYSNLPVNVSGEHGAAGGDCVICVLATPMSALRPSENCIDYRTVVLLEQLLTVQAEVHHEPGRASFASALRRHPIYVVQPSTPLKSGLLWGFFCLLTMKRDIDMGRRTGRAFVQALSSFEGGDAGALNVYELRREKVPPVPAQPPVHRESWMLWINRDWVGKSAGAPRAARRVAGTVAARRARVGSGPRVRRL